MHFDVVYIFLYLLVLIVFCKAGRRISAGGNYWANALWCLFIFTFVIGSRYGRGPDYPQYIIDYNYMNEKYGQYGFTFIKSVLKDLGVDAYHIFYHYAWISMLGGLIFLKRLRRYAVYMFPALFLATFGLIETQVRQSLSYGFLFVYFANLFNIKFVKLSDICSARNTKYIAVGLLFLVLSYIIHSANILNAVLLTGLYLFIRIPVPLYFAIPAVVFSSFVLPRIYDISLIMPILNLIGGKHEMFDGYLANQENWFSNSAYSTEVAENPVIKVFETLGVCSLLYFSTKLIRKAIVGQEFISILNFFFIGTCISQGFRLMEIMERVGMNIRVFWFYLLGYVLYYRQHLIEKRWERYLSYFLVYWLYRFFKYLFMSDTTKFLWDVGYFI